jgi:hypothetical protein
MHAMLLAAASILGGDAPIAESSPAPLCQEKGTSVEQELKRLETMLIEIERGQREALARIRAYVNQLVDRPLRLLSPSEPLPLQESPKSPRECSR